MDQSGAGIFGGPSSEGLIIGVDEVMDKLDTKNEPDDVDAKAAYIDRILFVGVKSDGSASSPRRMLCVGVSGGV